MVLAKALYDNEAETPEELTFSRGDILAVIQQEPAGLPGWWLCTHRGKRGIAPGNRLRLVTPDPATMSTATATPDSVASAVGPAGLDPNGHEWRRRSFAADKDKVQVPQKIGGVYVYNQPDRSIYDYDVPPSRYFPSPSTLEPSPDETRSLPMSPQNDSATSSTATYDIPRSTHGLTVFNPHRASNASGTSGTGTMSSSTSSPSLPSSLRSSLEVCENYDIPKSKKVLHKDLLDLYDAPRTVDAIVGRFESSYEVPKSTQRSSLDSGVDVKEDIYSAPLIAPKFQKNSTESTIAFDNDRKSSNATPSNQTGSVYDVPPTVTRDSFNILSSDHRLSTSSSGSRTSEIPPFPWDPLPLDHDAALDTLSRLQQDLQTATIRFLSFASATWRQRANLSPRLFNIKLAVMSVRTALQEFLDFAHGALVNSTACEDRKLPHKLQKHVEPLEHALSQVNSSMRALDDCQWSLDKLCDDHVATRVDDPFGDIVTVVKDLAVHAKSVSALVQFNSSLIFKHSAKKRPLPAVPLSKPEHHYQSIIYDLPQEKLYVNDRKDDGNEYDYVQLESSANRKNGLNLKNSDLRGITSFSGRLCGGAKSSSQNALSPDESRGEQRANTFSKPEKINKLLHQNQHYQQQQQHQKQQPQQHHLPQRHQPQQYQNHPKIPQHQHQQHQQHQQQHQQHQHKHQHHPKEEPRKQQSSRVDDEINAMLSSLEIDSTSETTETDSVSVSGSDVTVKAAACCPDDQRIGHSVTVEVVSSDSECGDSFPLVSHCRTTSPPHSKTFDSLSCQREAASAQISVTSPAPGSDASASTACESVLSPTLSPAFRERLANVQKKQQEQWKRPLFSGANCRRSVRRSQLGESDKMMLVFYSGELEAQSALLLHAIDTFLECVRDGKDPKSFVGHSKYVVIAAHKLAFVGDTLSQHICNQEVKGKVTLCSNHLCDCLKLTVSATKAAAHKHNDVLAVQAMVDRVVDVSHASHELKLLVQQAAQL